MTEEEAIKICSFVKIAYDKNMSRKDAEEYISTKTGQSKIYSGFIIYVLGKMKHGECYAREINKTLTGCLLAQILDNDGKDGLKRALVALGAHIQYREKNKSNRWGLREAYDKYSAML